MKKTRKGRALAQSQRRDYRDATSEYVRYDAGERGALWSSPRPCAGKARPHNFPPFRRVRERNAEPAAAQLAATTPCAIRGAVGATPRRPRGPRQLTTESTSSCRRHSPKYERITGRIAVKNATDRADLLIADSLALPARVSSPRREERQRPEHESLPQEPSPLIAKMTMRRFQGPAECLAALEPGRCWKIPPRCGATARGVSDRRTDYHRELDEAAASCRPTPGHSSRSSSGASAPEPASQPARRRQQT